MFSGPIRSFAAAITVLSFAATPVAQQQTIKPPAFLIVAGDVTTALKLSPADVKAMPHVAVKTQNNEQTTTYEGVRVGDVLKKAGVPAGNELRGDALSTYIVAKAADGYQVVFSLGELDVALTKNDIIIADSVDGKPLFDYQGPFRLVVPSDTRGARSVRMLERLDVIRLKK